MKLSLVVAAGAHQGKAIPIPTPQFLIGRDPSCQLRPASEVVSKRHCAVLVRDGKIWVRDFGSTNGTFVNGQQIAEEVEVKDGDHLKVGPLEFTLKVEGALAKKPAVAPVAAKPQPAPPPPVPQKQTEADKDTAEEVALDTPPPSDDPHSDKIAAMLLLSEEADPAGVKVPEGSTVLEIPNLPDPNDPNAPTAKKEAPKPTYADTSSAAEAILRKYRQRPRT
jgi:pSer/pThr/pTyr-binding forkhead associated (FHA) protein